MATNQYFKNFSSVPQQDLIRDVMKEVIQLNGIDVVYLPRTNVGRDEILGEDAASKFTTAYQVEMYVNSTDAFGGAGDQLTKFGLDVQDELILTVHKDRFTKETTMSAPREGDLLYFILSKSLFQISFVEHEKPFYTLGKNHVFELTCEKFVYSNEKFEVPAGQMGTVFDAIERDFTQTEILKLSAGAGDFMLGEKIYQGVDENSSTAAAEVASWNATQNTLSIFNKVGTFVNSENITGVITLTTRTVTSQDDQDSPNLSHSDNKVFETEGDNILDFSEIDPWAEGDL